MAGTTILPAWMTREHPGGFAVVDVETTGLNPAQHRVLQVAVVQLAPDGQREETWSSLIDPNCDPGPIHIHGITRERLAAAPSYGAVASNIARMTAGRMLVAHNATFDCRFLLAEAERCLQDMTIGQHLCTLALTRRLDLPVPDFKLTTLTSYWGIPHARAHDALDDTLAVAEVFRRSVVLVEELGGHLPIALGVRPATRNDGFPPAAPRVWCPWVYPGPWSSGRPLVQGMKIALSGESALSRETMTTSSYSAGARRVFLIFGGGLGQL